MACTTLLVGRGATNDGSTIVARNEDCENGDFNPKGMAVVAARPEAWTYTGVNSHLSVEMAPGGMRYTCVPDTDLTNGIWGEAGVNAANVSMSATETVSTNARVLGADPLVAYDEKTGRAGGLGEEDLVTLVLPYATSARDGVLLLGGLLERYGTYEMNGVAFGDAEEIWYLETVGGHHWIARRVPDDCYVAQPNRLGIDRMDLADALGEGRDYLCSADLADWMRENRLCCEQAGEDAELVGGVPRVFNPRTSFGSFTWLDIVYNNPRAWYIESRLNRAEGPMHGPDSFDAPWCRVPDAKIAVEDVRDILGSTYEGTEFNPYGFTGDEASRKLYRPIGINRTCELSILQIRPYAPAACRAVQWVSFASGAFNTSVALYANVRTMPAYVETALDVDTNRLYWASRMIAALADPEFWQNYQAILDYQQTTMAQGYWQLRATDEKLAALATEKGLDLAEMDDELVHETLEASNDELAAFVRGKTEKLLASVLYTRSLHMKNAFGAQDH
jgi:dipeptidase